MNQPENAAVQRLRDTVQHNCNICDARHAADFSMCVYLLKMREFYRWEQGLGFDQVLSADSIGDWLRQREALWAELVEAEFATLPFDDGAIEPFDAEAINRRLAPLGLVYSAGYGRNANPHFVLAELIRHERHDGYQVYHCGAELARDLAAPPAMAQGDRIYLRDQSIQRMIWEKIQESDWHAEHSPMHRALRHYGFADDAAAAVQRIGADVTGSILDHEVGELRAGLELGPDWERMLLDFSATRAELMLRALRDLFADALVTLPALLAELRPGLMHFYASSMTAMRRHLHPAFQPAYQQWLDGDDPRALHDLVSRSESHWRQACQGVLDYWRRQGVAARPDIERMIEEQRL